MNIIEPSSIYLKADGLSPYQFMEKAGRTCYKSESNITSDSAIKFVQGLKKSGHHAMLEHSHIYLIVNNDIAIPFITAINNNDMDIDGTVFPVKNFLNISAFSSFTIISGSFRAFIGIYDPACMEFFGNQSKQIHKALSKAYPEVFDDIDNVSYNENSISVFDRNTFINFISKSFDDKAGSKLLKKHLTHTCVFICDRGITHEFVRHRLASFAQESTRYCNYSKDKFGNEITVIRPNEFKEGTEEYNAWKEACEKAEYDYFKLLELGVKPQFARDVLPTSVKTEIIITATENEWQHIVNLRKHGTTGAPHPQIVQSMDMIYDDLCIESNNRIQ